MTKRYSNKSILAHTYFLMFYNTRVSLSTPVSLSIFSEAVKSVNPFLLVAMVVSALLVLLLTFVYLIRKNEPQDADADGAHSGAPHTNRGFEPDQLPQTPQPPSYEDALKAPWTVWATAQQTSGATPPPTYEDVQRMFPFPR